MPLKEAPLAILDMPLVVARKRLLVRTRQP